MKGKVYLCGAGCIGSDGLTQQAANLIVKADVLVCDDLLDPEILKLNPEAKIIKVGKRKGSHSKSQDEICALLVELAGKYQTVVRLKGGDPFVFGRAAEEIDALTSVQIPYEVIPGLSSAIAIPELVGIPVTARHEAQSFAVITAQRAKEEAFLPKDLKWISAFHGTLVVLMGFSLAEKICRQLCEAGWDPLTPAAVVWSAEMGHPKGILANLKTLPQKIKNSTACAPAVLVFGKTAARMTSGSEHPVRIGLTCTKRMKESVLSWLGPGYEAVSVLEPEHLFLDWDLASLREEPFNWYCFCSPQGAKTFLQECRKKKADLRDLPKIACIGPATSKVMESAGIYPDLVCQNPSVESLCKELQHRLHSTDRIASFRSALGHAILEDEFSKICSVRRIDLYNLVSKKKEDPKDLDWLVFASPSSVDSWFANFDQLPEQARILCLSHATGSRLKQYSPHPYEIPDEVSAQSLAQFIQTH